MFRESFWVGHLQSFLHGPVFEREARVKFFVIIECAYECWFSSDIFVIWMSDSHDNIRKWGDLNARTLRTNCKHVVDYRTRSISHILKSLFDVFSLFLPWERSSSALSSVVPVFESVRIWVYITMEFAFERWLQIDTCHRSMEHHIPH